MLLFTQTSMYDLRDDFINTIDTRIWSLERVADDSCYGFQMTEGKHALNITVHEGDRAGIGNDGRHTERTEITEHTNVQIPILTEIWYSFNFFFPPDFPIVNNRLVFAQWKQQTVKPESPFLSWRYSNGKLFFQTVFEYEKTNFDYPENNDIRGTWHTVLLQYRLRNDKTGFVKTWLDSSLFAEYDGPMGSSHPTSQLLQFKMGLYRDQLEIPQTILFSQFRRGETKESCMVI